MHPKPTHIENTAVREYLRVFLNIRDVDAAGSRSLGRSPVQAFGWPGENAHPGCRRLSPSCSVPREATQGPDLCNGSNKKRPTNDWRRRERRGNELFLVLDFKPKSRHHSQSSCCQGGKGGVRCLTSLLITNLHTHTPSQQLPPPPQTLCFSLVWQFPHL